MRLRAALRAILVVVASLVLLGAQLIVPSAKAGSSAPKELLIYYGWPSAINRTFSVPAAAEELGRYDYVILGDGLQNPSHGDHANTISILAHPSMAGTKVFGYIDLGVATQNLSLSTIEQYVYAWKATGADGIFYDDYGYDFGVSRQRQNAAVDFAHAAGMPVVANSWVPADAFDDAVDPTANPAGLPTHLGPSDLYLFESHVIKVGQYAPETEWRTKAEQLAYYQGELGFGILSITTNSPADAYSETKFFDSWDAANLYGHDATGWGEYLFSSNDSLAPYRTRPPGSGGGSGTTTTTTTAPAPPPTTTLPPPSPPTTTTTVPTGGGNHGGSGSSGTTPGGSATPIPQQPTVGTATCAKATATIVGTPGDDRLLGTAGADVIAGLGGDDVIYGFDGDDVVCGGHGDDDIHGGSGDDILVGGTGADRLYGEPGDDILRGRKGSDFLVGGDGNDVLVGGRADDLALGGDGNDTLKGGKEADYLTGESGRDTVKGGPGDDRVFGGSGDDKLRGGAGDDYLGGEAGTDRVAGNAGKDTLFGGSGDDRATGGFGPDEIFGGDGSDRGIGGPDVDVCVTERSRSCES